MRKSDAWEAVRSAVLATTWLLVRARNNYICVYWARLKSGAPFLSISKKSIFKNRRQISQSL